MNRIRLSIRARLRSPFLFPGLAAGTFGMDAIALRDRNGNPLIPQDQVRGVLRHALGDVIVASNGAALSQGEFETLFGKASGDAAGAAAGDETTPATLEPHRGRILFSDLRAPAPQSLSTANRVRINQDTGAADPGGLLLVELIAPYGSELDFGGEAILFATDEEADRWIAALDAATSWVSGIGSMKSAGFGEVVELSVEEEKREKLGAASVSPLGRGRCSYLVSIDRPFLVDARRVANNVFAGAEVIPGSAIKGLLARKLALMGHSADDDESFTRLSVSHARVEGASGPLPLSLVSGQGLIGDALHVPFDAGATIAGEPGRFAPDWKDADWARARDVLKLPEAVHLERDPRMHVMIAPTTGIAEEEMLFVTVSIDPGTHKWRLDVDFSAIDDESTRELFAQALESGLDGLGRTGAALAFERTNCVPYPPVRPVKGMPGTYAVILEADAVMANPADGDDTPCAYQAYWNRVCPGARLENFYASQRLAGGYIALRYKPGEDYEPFWVTEAGSVFLLSGDVSDRLEALVRHGLPPPVIDGKQTDWRTCPYQPENGYGRIRADYDAVLTREVQHV